MSVYDKLASAYRVSCPIVSLTTSDPARSVEAIGAALNKVDTDDKGKPKKNQRTAVVIEWDCVRGLSIGPQPQHPTAQKALSQLTSDEYLPAQLTNAIEKLPEACVLVIHNAHRQLDKVEVVQAIWLCRDKFKANRRMLILLGTSIRIPAELQHDCIRNAGTDEICSLGGGQDVRHRSVPWDSPCGSQYSRRERVSSGREGRTAWDSSVSTATA